MNPQLVKQIFSTLSKANPSPKTELKYNNPYCLLIAVLLSAQSTDISVNKATKALFDKVQNPQDMISLGITELIRHIKTIGLFNNKAKNIIQLSQILVDKYNGEIPSSMDSLQQLPGVGRKTANVVLNVIFNQPTIAVDTHVLRVSNRIGLAKDKNPLKVEQTLDKIIPDDLKKDAHNLLIIHGRYCCKAKTPLCSSCIINNLCDQYKKQ